MTPEQWDMHTAGPEILAARTACLPDGVEVVAEVICHHAFGIGVRLVEHFDFAHLDVPAIRPTSGDLVNKLTFPPVGSRIKAVVLGYTGTDQQMRLRMPGSPTDR